MLTINREFESADGCTMLRCKEWMPDSDEDIVGILHIAHGATQHMGQYDDIATFFVERGFVVLGFDFQGHGDSVADGGTRMSLGSAGCWHYLAEDIHKCHDDAAKSFGADLPYIMLGFSLGSFAVRDYLIRYPAEATAAVLVGTAQQPYILLEMAKQLALGEAKRHGWDSPTQKITDMTFGKYNRQFAPCRTKLDWLCSEPEVIDRYLSDPKFGGDFTAGMFVELLRGMQFTGSIRNVRQMEHDTPILLLSGKSDPVGENGKGVMLTKSLFEEAGCSDVSIRLLSGRHDVLRDTDGATAISDIHNWIRQII